MLSIARTPVQSGRERFFPYRSEGIALASKKNGTVVRGNIAGAWIIWEIGQVKRLFRHSGKRRNPLIS
jgi:hypothetical protein